MTSLISAEIKAEFGSPRKLSKSAARRDSSDSVDVNETITGEITFSCRNHHRFLTNNLLLTGFKGIDDELPIDQYALRDPLLFGDYRNMINKNETRYYEDLLDYEAIYFLFEEVSQFSNCSPTDYEKN